MKLRVKKMNISTGSVLVGVINKKDAQVLDLHSQDRIKISKDKQVETIVTNTADSDCIVQPGTIGVFDEVVDSLGLVEGEKVDIRMARKPHSLDYIKRKLDGKKLTGPQMRQIIWDIVYNKLSEIELTYFVSACYAHPLDKRETVDLIRAMTSEGDIFKVDHTPVMDKHCIGGVPGNRTSMLVVPILAAAGCTIPKTSSRSITSPAGTADTMECLSNVSVDMEDMRHIVDQNSACLVWGGALNLAPADDKIIHVEKPLVIDAQSQLIASILSKKLSVSSTHILIDIPVGKSAKVESMYKARKLKKAFEELSRKLKVKIRATITDGSHPIGKGIGPRLEARDVLWVLKNDHRQPHDLREKAISISGKMLEMADKAARNRGAALARQILDSGAAQRKFMDILSAQGARVTDPASLHFSKYSHVVGAPSKGRITHVDNKTIAKLARVAGAPLNGAAGLYLSRNVGDYVTKGMPLFTVYAGSRSRLKHVQDMLEQVDPYVIR